MRLSSALGLDVLKDGVMKKEKKTVRVAQCILCGGLVLAILWGCINIFHDSVFNYMDQRGFKPDLYNDISFNLHNLNRFLFFALTFCLMILVYVRIRYKKTAMSIIVLLIITDLFLANYGYYRSMPWNQFAQKDEFVHILSGGRNTERYFVTNRAHQEFEGLYYDVPVIDPSHASVYELFTVKGVEVMKITRHDIFINLLLTSPTLQDARRYIDVSGIKYMLTSYEVTDNNFSLLYSQKVKEKTIYLYEYKPYIGRFLLFGKARFVNDDREMINKLIDRNIDLNKELIIIGEAALNKQESKAIKGNVRLISYKANKAVLESNTDNDAFLYVSDTYYPGWRAYVDGKETKIYRANLAFRAVEVPKGKHTVVFRYVPMSFYIGLCLTIFGILLCIWLWRRDKKTGNR